DAILASCCIPVIFKPVEIDEEQFVDGGITDNMPIIPLKERKVDYIIGLHCNQPGEGYKSKSWEELMLRSLHMSIASATYLQKDRVDLFLDPPAMAKYGVFDFKKAPEMYALGYTYAQEFLEEVDLPKKGWFK
ncbi:MAG: patatin-like phospholipase family protein, partial [Bacteroidota bacterium]